VAIITTIDGRTLEGRLVAIADGKATLATDAGQTDIALADLLRIHVSDAPDLMAAPGRRVLTLTDGRIGADAVTLSAGRFELTNRLLGKVGVDLGLATILYQPEEGQLPSTIAKAHRDFNLPKVSKDFLIIANERGKLLPTPGALKSIAADNVLFTVDSGERTVDAAKVRVIELCGATTSKAPAGGMLTATDGSALPFAAIALADGKLTLKAPGLSADAIKASAVADIYIRSERCLYLSDLKPAKVEQAGMFEPVFNYRVDRNSTGGALAVNGERFERGLGLHSRCELTYDLDGKYGAFAAVIGIDDCAGKRGNAAVKVSADGREVVAPVKLVSGGKCVPIRCDLKGVKQLIITADFGDDNIDVGDHVDLLDARLIKPN
jgi:hypothetical protein